MISVCMTTYNGERFVKEQIESILAQLGRDDELIISDDGSTDKTIQIISSFNDRRIILLNHIKEKQKFPFSYTTANINYALKFAKGDYIFLADQDDVWLPLKVSKMVSICQNCDLVLADCMDVDKDLNIICNSHFALYNAKIGALRNWIGPCCYLGSNMCFRRTLLPIFMEIPSCVPHDLWIGVMTNLKAKMLLLHDVTMLYRRHDSNVSALNNKVLPGVSSESRKTIRINENSLGFKLRYRFVFLLQLLKYLLLHR